jgi:hypothetical protein
VRAAQRAQRRPGLVDVRRAEPRGAEDRDAEDLRAGAVESRQDGACRVDLAPRGGRLAGVGEVHGEVPSRERCAAVVAVAPSDAHRFAHRRERAGVSQRVAREPERVQRGDLPLAVVFPACERERMLGGCEAFPGIGLHEPVGPLGERERPVNRSVAGHSPGLVSGLTDPALPCGSPRPRTERITMRSTGQMTRAELLRRAAVGGVAAAVAPGWLAGQALGAGLNGNKRTVSYASDFTRRVGRFPRTAYLLHRGARGSGAVVMVIDELLVGEKAARDPQVTAQLTALGAADTGATVFGGLASPPTEDVHIWRLNAAGGLGPYPDVAEIVWDVELRRRLIAGHIPFNQVAPNHVLIPANWHTCPWSPPEEPDRRAEIPVRAGTPVDVVVLDSGYIAEGPITSRVERRVDYGEWFTKLSTPGYAWVDPAPEVTDAPRKDRRLDTLVGHANFVAGVVAQACPQARITLVSQNGAFVQSDVADTPIPTEASVARALWEHRNAAVINVGFAFATLPSTRALANSVDPSGPPSWTLGLVLRGIPRTSVLVAPAGNQSSRVRQYPAAFGLMHPNVVGVGSIDIHGQRSFFSNYGPWVACCTVGENVLSSFITSWDGPTEDAEPKGWPGAGTHPAKDFTSGWALWSGTSFAAPKVAGAIARLAAAGPTPLAAWATLKATGQSSGTGMGVALPGLAPS